MRIVVMLGLVLVGCKGATPALTPTPTPTPTRAAAAKNTVAFAGKIVPVALDSRRPRPPAPSNVEVQRVPRAPRN